MRIAIDIDSTLHDYWAQFSEVVERRAGVSLPYADQHTWGVPELAPEQLRDCVMETHTEPYVLAGVPYPGAVETVRGWKDQGHFIHVTSHRSTEAHGVTARWLDAIGLPYDELYCSYDKIARCREIGIDVLIDDSPVNLRRADDAGITPATLLQPWNRALCEELEIVCAPDWPGLARQMESILQGVSR
jgi:5'(3')-deoxyribonucleotidase